MKKQRKSFKMILVIMLILFIGTLSLATEGYESYYDVKLEYNGRKYEFNVAELAERSGITLSEYPYYFVGIEKNVGLITICYSKTRIYSNLSGNDNGVFYYTNGSEEALKVDIKANRIIDSYIINMQTLV